MDVESSSESSVAVLGTARSLQSGHWQRPERVAVFTQTCRNYAGPALRQILCCESSVTAPVYYEMV